MKLNTIPGYILRWGCGRVDDGHSKTRLKIEPELIYDLDVCLGVVDTIGQEPIHHVHELHAPIIVVFIVGEPLNLDDPLRVFINTKEAVGEHRAQVGGQSLLLEAISH